MIHQRFRRDVMAHDDAPDNPVKTEDAHDEAAASSTAPNESESRIQFDESDAQEQASTSDHDATKSADDLSSQVDDLITDAIDAVESLDDSVKTGGPTPADEAAVAKLADEVERLVDDASDAAGEESELDSVAFIEIDEDELDEPPAPRGEAPTGSVQDVEQVTIEAEDDAPSEASSEPTAEPVVETPVETPSPEVVAEAPKSIEALDATIEAEAEAFEDELDELEGEFHSADAIDALDDAPPPTVIEIDEADAEISLDLQDEPAPVEEPTPAAAAAPEIDSPFAGDAPAPSPQPRSTAPKPSSGDSAKPSSKSESKGKSKTKAKSKSAQESGVAVAKKSAVATHRFVLMPLARPLSRLEPVVRDSIGWVGLNTLFIALCLWIFLMLR